MGGSQDPYGGNVTWMNFSAFGHDKDKLRTESLECLHAVYCHFVRLQASVLLNGN